MSDVLCAVRVGIRRPTTLLAVVETALDTLATVLVAAHRTGLGCVALGVHDHIDTGGFALVFEHRRE